MINYNLLNEDIMTELIKYLPYRYIFNFKFSCKKYFNNKILCNLIKTKYFKPKDKNELYNAIEIWNMNEDESNRKFGDISRWNTELIDNMSFLFYNTRKSINIEDWIFSYVKDIRYIVKSNNKIDYTCNPHNINKILKDYKITQTK